MEFPLLGQQVAVDLANTVWVYAGQRTDALDSVAVAGRWLQAVADHQLGGGGTLAQAVGGADNLHADERLRADLQHLRENVRELLAACAAGRPTDTVALAALNEAAAAAPSHLRAAPGAQPPLMVERLRPADARTAVLAALAEDALLMAAELPQPVLACPGPGCLGLFVQDDPRRRYCSPNCANRARVARHYDRTRSPADPPA